MTPVMPKIYVDPGHGGKDPGAVDGISGADRLYTEEEDVNLSVALSVRAGLVRCGAQVKMSRTGDTYPTISQRAAAANAWGANYFYSQHFDAAGSASARGISVLYTSAKGKMFAGNVYKFLEPLTPWGDRGIINRDNLGVLNQTRMPAIIVEGGYLTNTEEEVLINNATYRKVMAEAIVKGICLQAGIKYIPPVPVAKPVPAPTQNYVISAYHSNETEARIINQIIRDRHKAVEVRSAPKYATPDANWNVRLARFLTTFR